MDAKILQNLRDGRDFLNTLTGVRVRFIDDPDEDTLRIDNDVFRFAHEKNIIWFRIKCHADEAAHHKSVSNHVENLRSLVSANREKILNGEETVQVKITFDGYEYDQHEIFEIEEV